MSTVSIAPEAVGNLKIEKDNNKNYAVYVNVENLPDPKRLNPPRNYYVVWIETGNSSKTKASLNAVSAVRPLRVFITAENDEFIRYPGNTVVLDTGNFYNTFQNEHFLIKSCSKRRNTCFFYFYLIMACFRFKRQLLK